MTLPAPPERTPLTISSAPMSFQKLYGRKVLDFCLNHIFLQKRKFKTEKENIILVGHLSGPQWRPVMLGVKFDP